MADEKEFKRTTLAIRKDVWKRARHYAVEHDIELQELVTRAIEEFLDQNYG